MTEAPDADDIRNFLAHAYCGHFHALEEFITRHGRAYVDVTNDAGVTALMRAAERNRLAAAQFLIGCGADVNYRSETSTPLLKCIASPMVSIKMVALLIGCGADVRAADVHDQLSRIMEWQTIKKQPELYVFLKQALEGGDDFILRQGIVMPIPVEAPVRPRRRMNGHAAGGPA